MVSTVIKRFIVVVLGLGFVAAGLVLPAQEAKGAPWVPVNGTVVFNHPRASKAAEFRHLTVLDNAIKASPRGSTIKFAQYLFNVSSTANALVAAYKRGVNVQVIMDDGTNTKQTRLLKRTLNARTGDPSWYKVCRRACNSNVPSSTMHAKIYLFSNTAGKPWVSMISSANPHKVNSIASWNNTHTWVNKPVLWNALNTYFTAMATDKNIPNYRPYAVRDGNITLFMYPQQQVKPYSIQISRELSTVRCRTARGFGTKDGRTIVRVENWGWTGGRNDVAIQLRNLKAAGCEVQVVINRARISRIVMNTLLTNTRNGKIKVWDAWKDKNRNDSGEMYLHHKAMAISGWVNGKNTRTVWTGSQNFTVGGTLFNNDLLVKIQDSTYSYNMYAANMDHLKKHCKFYTKVPKILRDTRGDGPQLVKGSGTNETGATEKDLESVVDR